MSCGNNAEPVSPCMYSCQWAQQQNVCNSWIMREADDFYASQITAPLQTDATQNNKYTKDASKFVSKPLREKNSKKNGSYKHVPHRDKPPQVVARRNARERRRVQAVNGAFIKLRKVVPIQNSRGKRVSKVKTLQNAIEYIQQLEELLQQDGEYQTVNYITSLNYASDTDCSFFGDLKFEDEL